MVKDNKNNKSLEEMFDNLSTEETKITDTKESKIKKRKVSIVLGTLTSVLLLGVGGAYYISQQETVEVERATNTVIVEDTGNKINNSTNNNQVIPLPDWAKKSYYSLIDNEKKEMIASLDNKLFGNLIQSIPSKADGYTSNPEEILDEEGFPNLYYTTILQEDIKEYAILYLNRIVNPIFGDWVNYQYGKEYNSEEIDPVIYSDMFTPDYIEKNKKNLPFLTDKNKNNFGYEWDEIKEKQARVIGVVDDIYEISSNDDFTEINLKATIATFANTKNSQIRKNYEVSMKLVKNEDTTQNNKILISEFDIKEQKESN